MVATQRVIGGGTLLTGPDWIPIQADLLLTDTTITALGPPGSFDGVAAMRIDASGALITPGFVNGHTHSHSNIVKGVARDWTLEASLLNGSWMAGARGRELQRISTLLGATELIASGCTGVFDLVSEFPGPTVSSIHVAAEAYASVGMRAVLAPMVADRSARDAVPALASCSPHPRGVASGAPSTEDILAVCDELVQAWPYDRAYISPALAPTIPAHCTPELFVGLTRLAREHGLRVHTHLAESKVQAIAGQERFGRSITAELDRLQVLGDWLTAAHAIWLDDADTELLARSNVTAVTVPASNLRLGSGIQDSRALLSAGVTLAIGTDGANSSDALDMVHGIGLTASLCRVTDRASDEWLTVNEVLDAATIGGAAACGRQNLGRIEPGAEADLVFFDLSARAFIPSNDLANQLITAGRASDVIRVMIAGRTVYEHGSYPGIDVSALADRASELTEEFMQFARPARVDADDQVKAAASSLAELRTREWPVQRLISRN